MAGVDRRLLRASRAARAHLVLTGVLAAAMAGLVVAQASLLARIVAGAAMHHEDLGALRGPLIALAAVSAARALVAGAFDGAGRAGAARVMSELRVRLARHVAIARPVRRADERVGDLAAAAVQGVDALEAYFASYLPQMALATLVPIAVLVRVAPLDPATAIILAATIPLLVVFMVLIGLGAKSRTEARWAALSLLSAHFLDVVRGLATLRAHGREHAQEAAIAEVGDRYRRETMATLRIAFLSALVLELVAMMGTALCAATVGIQLAGGHLQLEAGLTVLLLAPELYAPLRSVGQQFHASADGLAAAERIFDVLQRPADVAVPDAPVPAPDPARALVRFDGVRFAYPDRDGDVVRDVSLELPTRGVVALVGPSGSGKSTIAALLLRLADPTAGRVTCGVTDLRDVDPADWRARIAWVPQRARLFAGTLRDNVRLAAPGASDERVLAALDAAAASDLVAALPDGLDTVLGEGGRRLSAGESQRVALARAFCSDAPLVILDEPTANLDDDTASSVDDAIARLGRERTVLLIVHRPALAARADRLHVMDRGALAPAALEAVAA